VRLKSTWKYGQINKVNDLNDISVAIQIYPNPADESFSILMNSDIENDFTNYIISNLEGIEIQKGNISYHNKVKGIDIKDLTAGCYLVKVYNSNRVFIQKLLVAH
jgi:hypothetical protein